MSRKRPRSATGAAQRARQPGAHRQPVKVKLQPRRWPWVAGGVAGVGGVAVAGLLIGGGLSSGRAPAQASTLLAPVDSAASGATIDGIACQTAEQVFYHIHCHLAVFVNGVAAGIPAGVGVAPPRQAVQTSTGPYVSGGACLYWLHTHTADGAIHIESPQARTYTLGEFFDIWQQSLGPDQVGPAHGAVTAYVNGNRFTGNPRNIPLEAHALVQLDVGADVAPATLTFPSGL
jgi:hypothetical protein